MRTLLLTAAMLIVGTAVTSRAAEEDCAAFTKRGPLDRHAQYVQQVIDTLELTDDQKTKSSKIVAAGHASWRSWYKLNHLKVDAHNRAIAEAKTAGDPKRLAVLRKEKKVFMHTAPCLLRQPEPVQAVLTPSQRKLFDERLSELKRDLHRPPSERRK